MLPIRGPVERVNGQFCLHIPLDVGGRELVPMTKQIARIEGDALVVAIPDWMMKFLNISEGSDVIVDIVDGKFNIRSANWKPGDPAPELPGPPQ